MCAVAGFLGIVLIIMAVIALAIAYWYITIAILAGAGYIWHLHRKTIVPSTNPTDAPGNHQITSVRETKTNSSIERVKTVTVKHNRSGWDLVLDFIGTLTRH